MEIIWLNAVCVIYTRVRSHLLKITGARVRIFPNVTTSNLVDFRRLDNEAALKIENPKLEIAVLIQNTKVL